MGLNLSRCSTLADYFKLSMRIAIYTQHAYGFFGLHTHWIILALASYYPFARH